MQDFFGVIFKYRISATSCLLFFLLTFKPALAAETRSAENLPQFIFVALANNPELKASDARWHMFRNPVVQAGSLDDPMLILKIQNGMVTDPFNFGKEPEGGGMTFQQPNRRFHRQ
jgi:hypothetical protein